MAHKVAIVTGASRGIGKAIALRLAHADYQVALVARDARRLKETAEQCNGSLDIPCDLADSRHWERVIDTVVEKFGGIDVLVNNAGIHEQEGWQKTVDVNLRAVMGLTNCALPYLERRGGGSIINIASIAGIMGMAGSSAYCASKHGVMGFSRALFEDAREKNIKVSSICPGYVATDLTESPRLDSSKMIQPEDIAETVMFVIDFPKTGCPTEIVIRPQMSPRR